MKFNILKIIRKKIPSIPWYPVIGVLWCMWVMENVKEEKKKMWWLDYQITACLIGVMLDFALLYFLIEKYLQHHP